jgi:hypothetical protein
VADGVRANAGFGFGRTGAGLRHGGYVAPGAEKLQAFGVTVFSSCQPPAISSQQSAVSRQWNDLHGGLETRRYDPLSPFALAAREGR